MRVSVPQERRASRKAGKRAAAAAAFVVAVVVVVVVAVGGVARERRETRTHRRTRKAIHWSGTDAHTAALRCTASATLATLECRRP